MSRKRMKRKAKVLSILTVIAMVVFVASACLVGVFSWIPIIACIFSGSFLMLMFLANKEALLK